MMFEVLIIINKNDVEKLKEFVNLEFSCEIPYLTYFQCGGCDSCNFNYLELIKSENNIDTYKFKCLMSANNVYTILNGLNISYELVVKKIEN